MNSIISTRKNILLQLLGFNLVLILILASSLFGLKYLKSSVLEYSNLKSDEFNGAVYPIAYVPNWLKSKNTIKSMNFDSEALNIDEFVELPKYDTTLLSDSSGLNKNALLARYTYPVVYMGNYKLDYEEFAGSHPGIDIRAPIGTPVLSISNGVVIKVKNTETGDGKYVVIRHDNVKTINGIETVYSSYEHLSDIFVDEGTKISKGDVLGKVGMTGITTTPHLHFQIDRKEASFHPYWPYTFKDASSVNLDFFGAVNAGLGKENAIAYTINPMEFIQNNLSTNPSLNSAPAVDTVKAQEEQKVDTGNIVKIETSKELVVSASDNIRNEVKTITGIIQTGAIIEDIKPTQTGTIEIISTGTISPNNTNTATINSGNTQNPIKNEQIFNDISLGTNLYEATKYLYENKITTGYEDKTFRSNNQLSRKESLLFIFRLYNIKLDSSKILPFNDISKNDSFKPFLQKALDLGLISRNKQFRPNDTISRAEFVTILVRASGKIIQNTGNTGFSDIKSTDWYSSYVETFSSIMLTSSKVKKFEPNNTFNRGQIAQILYLFSKNK